ncbi:MAG: NifB/NifX family molybdenum-iron cluster-binding protein [Melioribacteraceae bacterium]|nr:NifB/NifX family molybdenum-iron cluster-binding protein [Melioribacteraceae bacterium]
MKKVFAIPTQHDKLCAHFGHCEKFTIVETEENKVTEKKFLAPPMHEPGAYPKFLAEHGVHVIIAGGMGQKAQSLFSENNIEVVFGVDAAEPTALVEKYLLNDLESGNNKCDH